MTYIEILNLIAIVISPIIAVYVGRCLQDRSEKRKDRMKLFQSVMTFRNGWTEEGVRALNNIHIVFADDEMVRNCWRKYYKLLCIQNPSKSDLESEKMALYSLLQSMSNSLGYKDKIKWEDIANPYIPMEMATSIQNNKLIQDGMVNLISKQLDPTIKQRGITPEING